MLRWRPQLRACVGSVTHPSLRVFRAQVITGSAKPKFFEHEREPIYEARHVRGQLPLCPGVVLWRARQPSNTC
jgi:hypothetical protein